MTDNQEREKFYHSSYVHESFISAISLLNDLMKILVGGSAFDRVIFKDLGFDCYGKNSIFNKTNICWFKYKFERLLRFY